MVRIRGGSVSAGYTTRFKLRDEDIDIVEPSTTKSPMRGTKKHGGKENGSAQKKHSEERQTTSAEQTEEQPIALPPVSDSEEELEQPTNVDASVTKSPRKGTKPYSKKGKRSAKKKGTAQTKERQTADPSVEQIEEQQTTEQNAVNQQATQTSTRKSPRTRFGGQTDVHDAPRNGKRKRTAREQTEAQIAEEPTPLPKFIDDDARDRFELVSQKGFITQRTIVPHEFCKLDHEPVLKLFEFQKWTHILTIPNTYYPDMLYQFFANLRNGRSYTDLVSRVNSVDIELNPDIVNTVLKIKIEDDFKENIANFF